MTREFEGKTEREAIDLAVQELGLERDEFDVEVLETQKSGFFNLNKKVRIIVHVHGADQGIEKTSGSSILSSTQEAPGPVSSEQAEVEKEILDFVVGILSHLDIEAQACITYRNVDKIGIRIDSSDSGLIIGKKGKNLDSIQVIVNSFAMKFLDGSQKIVLDTENYRMRREETLIRLAQKVGDQVLRTHRSKLLEPMNPFERRLIHTTLSSVENIETISEGDGLYKQVRVNYKGFR